jgi:AcrR family transcriptional regulator
MATQPASDDRRVRRTRDRLRGALFSLIHEKGYDAIAVKEILHRADVGRSTFYAHFEDKDELLASGIRAILRSGGGTRADGVVAWSLPLFERILAHQGAADAAMARGQEPVHAQLKAVLREHVGEELDERRRRRRSAGGEGETELELLAEQVASTFLLVLTRAMESGGRMSPQAADELFRALIAPALSLV